MSRAATGVAAVLAFSCSHDSVRWNRGSFSDAQTSATEATTQEPLYAEALPGFAQATVFPGTPLSPRGKDPRSSRIFALLRNGSDCGDAFAGGSAEVIWKRFSAAARREHRDLDAFHALLESTLAQLGQETRLRGEYIVATPKGVSYLRESEWSNAPNGIVLELAFAPDSTSRIAALSVFRSETRPIVVKIGEAADAAR